MDQLVISEQTDHSKLVTSREVSWRVLAQELGDFDEREITLLRYARLYAIKDAETEAKKAQAEAEKAGLEIEPIPQKLKNAAKRAKAILGKVKNGACLIGGIHETGKMRNDNYMQGRTLATIDVDNIPNEDMFFAEVNEHLSDVEYVIHSTMSHTMEKPRYRLIIPLDRVVENEQYSALIGGIQSKFKSVTFDSASYTLSQVMYKPSRCKDAVEDIDTFYKWNETLLGTRLCADDYIKLAPKEVATAIKRNFEAAIDSVKDKPIWIKAAVQSYSIVEAMESGFIEGTYEYQGAAGNDERYIWEGSTSAIGGFLLHNDGMATIFSDSDPIKQYYLEMGLLNGKHVVVNVFDFIRIHRFGKKDIELKNSGEELPKHFSSYPSMKAMKEWLKKQKKYQYVLTKLAAAKRNKTTLEADFQDVSFDDILEDDWESQLEGDNGDYLSNARNFKILLSKGPCESLFAYNSMSREIIMKKVPPWIMNEADIPKGEIGKANPIDWTEEHHLMLSSYLEENYDVRSRNNLNETITKVALMDQFHPIRDMIKSTEWDGIPRIDTYFIDTVGANDDIYVREVTRKMFLGGVRRAFEPGCDFELMIMLQGGQGVGKTQALRLLAAAAPDYINSSLKDISDPKIMAEHALHTWIFLIDEFVAFKKVDNDTRKDFLSQTTDVARFAYDKKNTRIKRHCFFVGATNKDTFLSDPSGERRYCPIRVAATPPSKEDHVWHKYMSPANRQKGIDYALQLWAEAYHYYMEGEADDLSLSPEVERMQQTICREFSHTSEDLALIEDWLENEQTVPSKNKAKEYKAILDKVCIKQIVVECLQQNVSETDKLKGTVIRAMKQLGWDWAYDNGKQKRAYFGEYGKNPYFIRKGK